MEENDIKKQLMLEKYEPIAIVGIGLKYPGKSNTLDEFSKFLYKGKSGIVDIPESRWDLSAYYSDDPQAKGKTVQSKGGYLESIDEFDPKFFNISPKEANYCDPQHRLLLECSWNALESANIDPTELRDSNGGVYVGIAQIDYGLDVDRLSAEDLAGNIGTGTAHSAACGRLSYFLGWRGPSMSIDTACSSSLVALHVATQGLRRHECNVALCAGVNAIHHPRNHIVFSQSNMLSADGYCKTFDDSADGYSRSEGCGVLVLKRLSDAKRDGDKILALVRGSAVAQDGESGGLTVPNGLAQTQLMRDALKSGLLEPAEIQYVEAHGTGTSLGDPIEVGAINKVFAESHSKQNPIKIGSIKSNIGHMEAGAGICGVIKVVQQLQSGLFYPHVNLKNPSRHIPWDNYVVSVPTELQSWDADKRRAMVNSFGFAGSIASIVLEQSPAQTSVSQTASTDVQQDEFPIFTVSAKNVAALSLQVERYRKFIHNNPDIVLSELCYTSNIGRAHLPARFAAGVNTLSELSSQLDNYLSKDLASREKEGEFRGGNVAFLFTGQGSQYVGMGEGLYARYPVFRHYINECEQLFEPYLGCSIKELIFGLTDTAQTDINKTLYTQPALFVVEYALSQLWMSWGIKPNVLLGHSIGEIVAATIAGLFSLADGIKLVATRARLMQSVVANGGMVAVKAKVSTIRPFLTGYDDVSFGAINGPEQCVISGGIDSLEKIKAALEDKDIKTKTLPVSNGFHSPLMAEVFEPFRQIFSDITFNEPELSFISNLTGKVATLNDVGHADYWLRHIGEPVNFAVGMQCIQSRGKHVFIEVGPSPALNNMGRICVKQSDHLWVSSLSPDIKADCKTLQNALATVYRAGLTVSWKGYHQQRPNRKIDLPMYAFDYKRYWLPESKALLTTDTKAGFNHHPLLGEEVTSDDGSVGSLREFRTTISAGYPAYLADHIVMGQVVFPGAAYAEILFALQDEIFGETSHLIRDMKIIEPLFLTEEATTSLHTRVNVASDGESIVETFSIVDGRDGSIERIHVTAILVSMNKSDSPSAAILDRLSVYLHNPGEVKQQHRIEDIYAQYSELGLPYGPEFRRIQSLFQYDNHIAIGKLRGINTSAVEYLPPFILDCAMQTLAGVVNIEDAYLPVSFESIELLKKPKGDLDVVIQLTSSEEEKVDLTADIVVIENSRPVFVVNKLKLIKVANTMASRRLYHAPKWFKQSLTNNQLDFSEPCHVMVINRVKVDFESTETLLDSHSIQLDFADNVVEAMQCISQQESITDICWFWKTQPNLSGDARLRAESKQNYQELLSLVSALAELGYARVLKVTLITEGAQWLPYDSASGRSMDSLAASSLWGFGHVMLNEYPALKTVLIDLPPVATGAEYDYRVLLDEWSAGIQGEHQLAYRQGVRHVKRIVEKKEPNERDKENFELAITEYGQFANIKPVPIDDVVPTGDQVCVAVKATGVNFKDVLNALGMLKQYAEDNHIEFKPLPLGFESSGTVIACGPAAQFNVGDDVIVSQLGCMQKRLTVSSDSVVLKPTTIDFSEAAGLSAAYVTAYYSLHNLVSIKRGDRVLIHAAAGGVGQAAVQLAKLAGAEIYATASPRKWELLKSQGVRHVMNSRTLDFTEELLEMTGGQGVDIALNSLNKDYVPATLRCLGKNGRFVELGKIGIWSKEQMHDERPDVNYQNFDLSEFDEKQLKQINKQTLEIIVANIEQGKLAPLPTVSYSLDEVEEAFTVLSQGRNVGKLVLRFDDDNTLNDQPVTLNENETYLVTGGFGALGRATLHKLAAEGARHITLISRQSISSAELADINSEIGMNVELNTVQGDISNADDVRQMLVSIEEQGKPLAGVFHAAGVLSDGLLANQTWEGFQRVFDAKIYGTWLLHQAVTRLPSLRYFVVYSSISSVLGMPGQSNYAAANSYMDTLMHWRKANNEPGLSINWGPWAEIGMAAELSRQQIKSIENQGVKFLKPAQGTRGLFKSLGYGYAQTMICEFDWEAFQANRPIVNALLDKVVPKKSTLNKEVDIELLISQSKGDREVGLRDILRAKVAAILRFDSSDEVAIDAKFLELGLDSLSSVELKNGLESAFKMPFPTAMLFDYSDIKSLSVYLSEQLVPSSDNENDIDDKEIENFSDADADAELAELQEFS